MPSATWKDIPLRSRPPDDIQTMLARPLCRVRYTSAGPARRTQAARPQGLECAEGCWYMGGVGARGAAKGPPCMYSMLRRVAACCPVPGPLAGCPRSGTDSECRAAGVWSRRPAALTMSRVEHIACGRRSLARWPTRLCGMARSGVPLAASARGAPRLPPDAQARCRRYCARGAFVSCALSAALIVDLCTCARSDYGFIAGTRRKRGQSRMNPHRKKDGNCIAWGCVGMRRISAKCGRWLRTYGYRRSLGLVRSSAA